MRTVVVAQQRLSDSWDVRGLGGQAEEPIWQTVRRQRSGPDYFLEHRTLVSEQAGTYRAGDLPVWTVHCPEECIGNSTIIEDDSVALHGPT